VNILDEIVLRGADVSRMSREVRRRYPLRFTQGKDGGGFIVYGPDKNKSAYLLLAEAGLRKQRPNRNIDLKGGINAIVNMLESALGKSRLTFHPRCSMLRKDFEQAQWREDGTDINRGSGRGTAITVLAHYISNAFPIQGVRAATRRFWK
jgi:hypothetical protein